MAAAPDPKKIIGVGESRVQRGRLSRGTRLTRMYLEVKGGTWETDQDSVSALQRVRQKEKCESLALKPDCLVQILALSFTTCVTHGKLLCLLVPQLLHL